MLFYHMLSTVEFHHKNVSGQMCNFSENLLQEFTVYFQCSKIIIRDEDKYWIVLYYDKEKDQNRSK